MRAIRSLLVGGSMVAICGCTVMQLQQESGQMTTRITDKQASLTQLESQRAAMMVERQKLLAEIDSKQVTLGQLHAGLERLRQENGRLKSGNEQQLREQQRVEADLQKLQAEIRGLGTDARPTDQAKLERIEALKKQIKGYLELMLTQ